jgi:hypothetical protein
MADETGRKKTVVDDYSGLEPYVPPEHGLNAILVDLDGTLCERLPEAQGGRSPYDETRVGEDTCCQAVLDTVLLYAWTGARVIFMSGRSEACRDETVRWLNDHLPEDLTYEALFMRPAGDTRRDWKVKYGLFNANVRERYRVRLVLDDRDQVVRMWRALGLPCFQVAEGNF